MAKSRLSGSEGGCDCGKVRFRFKADPIGVNCCHCRDCQRQTGSAFALNILIESDNVDMLGGAPEPSELKTASGKGQANYRCPHCPGFGLEASTTRQATACGSYVAETARRCPGRLIPMSTIFTDSKAPWVQIPDNARTIRASSIRARTSSAHSVRTGAERFFRSDRWLINRLQSGFLPSNSLECVGLP